MVPIPKGRNAPILEPTQPFGLGPDAALRLLPSRALSSGQVCGILIVARPLSNRSLQFCSFGSAFFAGRFQLAVACLEQFFFLSCQLRLGCHITDRTVQSYFVVMFDVFRHRATRVFDRPHGSDANAVPFDRTMVALDLAVGLTRPLHLICAMVNNLLK